MAFEGLSSRLQEITRKFKGKARITDSDLKEMLREVKLALLEADVNYKIVKEFMMGLLYDYGYDIVDDVTKSDICIINSCTVKNPSQDAFITYVTKSRKSLLPVLSWMRSRILGSDFSCFPAHFHIQMHYSNFFIL